MYTYLDLLDICIFTTAAKIYTPDYVISCILPVAPKIITYITQKTHYKNTFKNTLFGSFLIYIYIYMFMYLHQIALSVLFA